MKKRAYKRTRDYPKETKDGRVVPKRMNDNEVRRYFTKDELKDYIKK